MTAKVAKLGDVVEIKGGGTPSKANPAFWDGDIPWVSPKDMKCWEIDGAEDKITSRAIKDSTTNLIPENSILVVNRSGILKHTLPVGITRRPVAINQDIKALLCNQRSHPDYIAHIVKAAEPIILKWVRATTADNFPIGNLRELKIPLPPLDEQRRIAAILDKADALRRKRKRSLDLLNGLTRSIFQEMFAKKASANIISSASLGELCQKITDGTHQSPKWADEGVPFLFVSNIRGQQISFNTENFVSETEYEKLTKHSPIEPDDVLYTAVGSYGNTAVVPPGKRFVFQRHIAHLKPKHDRVNSDYLSIALEMPNARAQADRQARGVAQKTVTLSSLKEIKIPLPSIEIQTEFAAKVRAIRKQADLTARSIHVEAQGTGRRDRAVAFRTWLRN